MPVSYQDEVDFHDGERRMHQMLHVPGRENPSSNFLTPGAGYMVMQSPLMAIGVLDKLGRPWTTVLGAEPGFAQPIAKSVIGVNTQVDRLYDPVIKTLFGEDTAAGNVVKPTDRKIFSGLSIDLETRQRVKLAGAFIAGAVKSVEKENAGTGELQMALAIEESLGNCPKYLNKKHIIPYDFQPQLKGERIPLCPEAVELLSRADLFFMSTSHNQVDMDTNHRGGPPGFVRLLSNTEEETTIVYPEYSGNRLYQSLGNIVTTPQIGLVFPDFASGDVLYVTGVAEVLSGKDAEALLPHTNLAVKIKLSAARYVAQGLNFRGIAGEYSPYNPPVRYLDSERKRFDGNGTSAVEHASLVKVEKLTPTIYRCRFRLPRESKTSWKPGQYVALDFSEELDMGYSHMRDDDPASLNDDFIRTFTVSSSPDDKSAQEFEISFRKHGPVTNFLARQRPNNHLSVPVRGFGGDFFISQPPDETVGFVAGGIGITPLLPQLKALQLDHLKLIWSIAWKDRELVRDVFESFPELAKSTIIAFTGNLPNDDFNALEATVHQGRITADLFKENNISTWYICSGPLLRKELLGWLEGKRVEFEDFGY